MKALFLGKFQPPHLGHIRTILNIASQFEFLTIGITTGLPKIIDYLEIEKIFNEIFSHSNNIKIQIIDGMIEDGTASLKNIDFDIAVSGNQKVLEKLKQQGFLVQFQQRTEGIGYSGSEIRELAHSYNTVSLVDATHNHQFKIIKTSVMKPLEKVLPSHLTNIEELILKDNEIKKPIIIDNKYNIVLDGSHRYAFLVKHGFKYAPVIAINYDDESIFVGNHLKHRFLQDEQFRISKSEVISRAINENLFNARTTRHFFPFRKEDYPTPLATLCQGSQQNIDYLIENVSIEDEILTDLNYISEINDEIIILNAYIKEQESVKSYLNYQIEKMKVSLEKDNG